VSDPERERAVEKLKSHYALGTLSLGELERRVEGVYGARTSGAMGIHVVDLPLRGARELAVNTARGAQRLVLRLHVSIYATLNGSLIGLWLLTGQGTFWPAWLLVPSTALLAWHALLSRRLTRFLARLRW
jgi:hypothetical protein